VCWTLQVEFASGYPLVTGHARGSGQLGAAGYPRRMLSEIDIDRGSREERGAEYDYKLGDFHHGILAT